MKPEAVDIVVVGMGYVGIPCAALLADVEGFDVSSAVIGYHGSSL